MLKSRGRQKAQALTLPAQADLVLSLVPIESRGIVSTGIRVPGMLRHFLALFQRGVPFYGVPPYLPWQRHE